MKNWHAVAIAFAIAGLGVVGGIAQSIRPSAVNGCLVVSAATAPVNNQATPYTCDTTGALRMNTAGAGGSCTGTIDLTTGCVMPMLGGL